MEKTTEEKAKLFANEKLIKSRAFVLVTLDDNGEIDCTYLFCGNVGMAERVGVLKYAEERIRIDANRYTTPEFFPKPKDGHGSEQDTQEF